MVTVLSNQTHFHTHPAALLRPTFWTMKRVEQKPKTTFLHTGIRDELDSAETNVYRHYCAPTPMS
jgi:hypothetical protein